MKRKILSLFSVVLFFTANAQVVYVDETFDTEIPATWTVNNTGTTGWFWTTTDGRFPFTGFALIDSDASGGGTEGYLLSPVFDCSGTSVLNLEFDVNYQDFGSDPDLFQVDVWDGTTWQNVINWNEDHGSETIAEHVQLDITAYANAACQVRFFYTDYGNWDWYVGIDNVLIHNLNDNDLAANSILPIGVVQSGSTFSPTVKIVNIGSNDQSNFDITLVSTPAGYNETISNPGIITSGSSFVVDFPSWSPVNGTYTLTATVNLIGDANTANNFASSVIEVKTSAFGDLVHSFNTTTASQAGIETDGFHIFTSAWNSAYIYKYTMGGSIVDSFIIPGVAYVRDMAFNPVTGFFYGAAADNSLFEMDFIINNLESTITIPTASRAILYDDDDATFWANNWNSDLVEFTIAGIATGNTMPMINCFGLAYDNWSNPANPTFWAFSTETVTPPTTLIEYNRNGSVTGRQINTATVPGFNQGNAGGLASFEENGHAYLLADIQQDPNLIAIFYLGSTSNAAIQEVSLDAITISPNPSNGQFVITTEANYYLEVMDITGKIVHTQELMNAQNMINLSNREAGVYICRLTNGLHVINKKISIE